jgi:Ca2+-binding EF-hand superfamily protein
MTDKVGGPLKKIFTRLDRDSSGGVSRDEMKAHAKDAKVDSGMFAGKKLNGAADALMDKFDGDKNGNVTWDEFASNAGKLMPEGADGKIDQLVETVDKDGDAALSKKELSKSMAKGLEEKGVSMAGTKGEIGAKIAVHTADTDGDAKLSKKELTDLAADIAAQRSAIKRG